MAAVVSASQPADRGKTGSPASISKSEATPVLVPGEVKTAVITPQGRVEEGSVQVSGPISVIIQLRDEPILTRKKSMAALGAQERAHQLRQHHDRLVNAQAQLKAWIKTLEPGKRDEAFRHYRFAFNGLATTVSSETLKKLRQQPDVARVFRDGVVKATLADSVPLIGAPQMWADYGADGQGIRVAVIDTGIDYTHPDLGGGFGPGFKVIGGYDFINGDGDPMDDNGHGTHVAGIVAASGIIKGVAPGAKLLAYKVLGASGSGSQSTIIEGIDRAVDPDQDPGTDDGAQVINLSLGGTGDPDDAVSQVVDIAVNAGVVCVVAAGNSGSNYSTIGSPACAREALTVGASDNQDLMAYFSSRGPSQPDLAIKPDLTAPGVSIRSTWPGGGYQVESGTSMAAPHVAGAVALLLQLHPTWTPDIVKAVLSERAKDLGQDAFTQGNGRVQVVNSHLAKAAMIPNNLNFGNVAVSQGMWSKTQTLNLKNLDSSSRTYTLTMQGQTAPGSTWTITPSTVALNPGQSQVVSVVLTVDSSVLPFGPSPNMAFEAKLVANSGDDEIRMPVVFYKGCLLTINFDQVPESAIVFDQNNDPFDGFDYKVIGGFATSLKQTVTMILPPRKYDIMCRYFNNGQRYIVKENIDLILNNNLTININYNQEIFHHVSLKSLDSKGNEIWPADLKESGSDCTLTHRSGMKYVLRGGLYDFYFSDMSDAYTFDLLQYGWSNSLSGSKYYEFRHSFNGILNDLILISAPSKSVKLAFNVDPAIDSIWVGFMRYMMFFGGGRYWGNFSYGSIQPGDQPPWVLKRPFNLEVDLSSHPRPGFLSSQSSPYVMAYRGGSMPEELLYEGGLLSAVDGNTMGIYDHGEPSIPFRTTQGSQVVMGESPSFWTGQLTVSPGLATLSSSRGYAPLFYGQSADTVPGGLSYEWFQGTSLLSSGSVESFMKPDCPPPMFGIPSGPCSLKIPFDGYFINGQRGHAVATLAFDSSKTDQSPPFLKQFGILKNGETSSTTAAGGVNQLKIQVEDGVSLAQFQAFYQTSGDWQPIALPLPTGPSADVLVDLPSNLPQGFVNLKFVAADGDGNSLTQEMTPAFYHSALPAPGMPSGPVESPVGISNTYTSALPGAWGTVYYTFDWGDGTSATSGATPSEVPVSASHVWSTAGMFSVRVRVADDLGQTSEWSEGLTVLVPGPPVITTQPRSGTTNTGGYGWIPTFTVEARGTAPLSYQWWRNGAPIEGATSSSYTLTTFTVADDGARFFAVVSNPYGTVVSSEAILTVLGPPVITAQPQNISVLLGQPATFSVEASGPGPLGYFWFKNGIAVGGNSSTYTTAPTAASDDGGSFTVVVNNAVGSTVSNIATLTVLTAPSIGAQPQSTSVVAGQTATFSVTATGTGPLTYQWRKNSAAISGATSSSYTTPPVTAADNGATFSVVVTNAQGSVPSGEATLTVLTAPSIGTQPQSTSVVAGQTATFSVTATGTGPLTYQWRKNGAGISGATSSSYTTPAVTAADNGATFSVVVTNAQGSVPSSDATLTVLVAPSIGTQPQSSSVVAGQTATFSVTATGTGPLTYQWRKNSAGISGATSSSYTTPAVTAADNGATFSVVVTNAQGSVPSGDATLTVLVAPSIGTQPQSTSVVAGQTATFSVTATGTGPLTYQWRKNGAGISGATSSSYTTPAVTAADNGATFSVVVTNAQGSVPSGDATLTVLVAPSIGTQPQSTSVVAGQTATFSVTATGTGPLTYQWRKNGAAISGATSSSYTTPAVTAADNGATFSVVVTNAQGSVPSSDATLTVLTALVPTVEVQPAALGCFPGEAIAFTARVTNATDTRVTWTVSAGTIDTSGRFNAPGAPGVVTVTATSLADPSRTGMATITVRGTDFDGNTALNPKLLGLAHAMGSNAPADLAKYDFNGDGWIDDADLTKLYLKMGW
nr:S8 family serine peptidase [Geothrix fuzhouensis]